MAFLSKKIIPPNRDPRKHLRWSTLEQYLTAESCQLQLQVVWIMRWLNYDFQRTEEHCSDVSSLVVRVDDGRPIFILFQTQNAVRISMKLF